MPVYTNVTIHDASWGIVYHVECSHGQAVVGVWKRWDFYFLRQLKENAVYVLEWIAQEKKENKRSKRCVEVKEIDSKTATCRGPLTTAPATSLISPCIRVALCHL